MAHSGPVLALDVVDLVRHFPDALFAVERTSLRIVHASTAATDQLGFGRRDVESLTLRELVDLELPLDVEPGRPFSGGCRWIANPSQPIEVHVRIAAASPDNLARRRASWPRPDPDRRGAARGQPVFGSRRREHPRHDLRQARERSLVLPFQPRGGRAHRLEPRAAPRKDRPRFLPQSGSGLLSSEGSGDLRAGGAHGDPRGADLDPVQRGALASHQEGARLRGRPASLPARHLGGHHRAEARRGASPRARARARGGGLEGDDAIVTWTPEDGKIVSCNPAAAQLYGIDSLRATDLFIDSIVPTALRAELRSNTEQLLAGHKIPLAQTYRLREGLEIEVEESLSLIPGASDRPARIASIARDIGEIARLRRAAEILAGTPDSEPESMALAPAMREVIEASDVVAQDDYASVLLLGETGVGKSWLARRIHQKSARASKPFLAINCAGLAPQLVESELFGHERGAFTGAAAQKRGLVEAADGGTLLLDEVGELSIGVQAQLLTFLDEHRFRRVGATRVMQADVRIFAATNLNLPDRVASGQFRKDLYYRLSVVPIRIPALRERREEIPALARSILTELGKRASRRVRLTLGPGVTAALQRYDWPGNLRELRNALERALILSRGDTIALSHLPPEIRTVSPCGDVPLRLEDVERAHILRILGSCQGNRTHAAEILGISRSTLKRNLAEMSGAGVVVPAGTEAEDGEK